MKKTLTILAALAVSFTMNAADATATRGYSVAADFTLTSKYVYRGLELARSSFQPSVELSVENFYAGVWANMPLRDKNLSNETDFYLGYGLGLGNDWRIDMGMTFYTYNDQQLAKSAESEFQAPRGNTCENYIGITGGNFAGFTPSAYLYFEWKTDVLAGQVSLGYSVPFKDYGTSLDFNALFGITNNGPGASNNVYYGFGVTIPYTLAQNATVALGLQYASTDVSINPTVGGPQKRDLFYATLSITVGF